MIGAVFCVLLGGLVFQEQEMPYLSVSSSLSVGESIVSHKGLDLNRDGRQDLLVDGQVLLQQDGGYPPEGHTKLPPLPDIAKLDVWQDLIYVRHAEGLQQYSWSNGAWVQHLDQALTWAAPIRTDVEKRPLWTQNDFLHDVDGDGQPEIICVTQEGVVIYGAVEGIYEEVRRMAVMPKPHLSVTAATALWPEAQRRFRYPVRKMQCSLLMEDGQLTVIERVEQGQQAQYRGTVYPMTLEGANPPVAIRNFETEWVPERCSLLRLNEDNIPDLLLMDWEYSTASAVPAPIQITKVSLDGGKSFQSFRARQLPGYRMHAAMVDVNGDGRMDVVQERVEIFDRGIRESVMAMLTKKTLRHTIAVYLQGEDGFSKTADYQQHFSMQFKQAPAKQGTWYNNYLAGFRHSLTGDVDGDGWKDVVVQESIERLDIRSIRDGALLGSIPVSEAEDYWKVHDLNGDGRSEICIYNFLEEEYEFFGPGMKVHFSLGEAP